MSRLPKCANASASDDQEADRRYDEGSAWINLDYLDVVVHVFTDEARDYYRLESLWVPQEHWEGE